MGHLITEADVVSRNLRAQAIAAGSLRDLTTEAREAGFRRPVAITTAAYAMAVATDCTGAWDERVRRSTLLSALRRALATAWSGQHVAFRVPVIRQRPRPETVQLRTLCGPGPIIITIPGER